MNFIHFVCKKYIKYIKKTHKFKLIKLLYAYCIFLTRWPIIKIWDWVWYFDVSGLIPFSSHMKLQVNFQVAFLNTIVTVCATLSGSRKASQAMNTYSAALHKFNFVSFQLQDKETRQVFHNKKILFKSQWYLTNFVFLVSMREKLTKGSRLKNIGTMLTLLGAGGVVCARTFLFGSLWKKLLRQLAMFLGYFSSFGIYIRMQKKFWQKKSPFGLQSQFLADFRIFQKSCFGLWSPNTSS